MAVRASKQIKRLSVSVNGPVIYGMVQSQSGISTWYFKVDFNDYGHITGSYWLSSDNSDSNIPEHYADNVASLIKDYNPEDYDYEEFNQSGSSCNSKSSRFSGNFCPSCGEKITVTNAAFCSYCGNRLF